MPVSMTGFGRAEYSDSSHRITIEIKSVNNRYLDTAFRIPKEFNPFEQMIRQKVNDYVKRGRVDLYIHYYYASEDAQEIKVNAPLALAYQRSFEELAQVLKLNQNISLGQMVNLPDVLNLEHKTEEPEQLWHLTEPVLTFALEELKRMRENEGNHLKEDLINRLKIVCDLKDEIAERTPFLIKEYEARLREKIVDLLQDMQLDESRLMTEVAIMANRSDLTEELVRFQGHIKEFYRLLGLKNDSVGRKLDFLLQELNREVNTIGSKANDLSIGSLVIELKAELEKIREQVQNIE